MGSDATDAPPAVGLNPFEPGFYENPYPQYTAVREAEPLHRTALGPWLVTRWEDVHRLLREPGTSVEDRNSLGFADQAEQLAEMGIDGASQRGATAILNIDPPDHDRLRRLVSKAFTPRTIAGLQPRIEGLVDLLLDQAATTGPGESFDVVAGLAFPLPFAVITEMLGMPESQDIPQLRAWSHTLVQSIDPILFMTKTDEILEAAEHVSGVVTEVIRWKRGRLDQDDDLLTALIRAEEGGDTLTEQELIDNVMLLFLAGHETTVNLIGNGTNALLRNRGELERLVADPELDATAVDELLRYDSPVQFSRRIVMKPIEIAGHAIDAGEFVMTGLGAANRDPRKFGPDADHLRLDRETAKEHVSFGSGVHHCLGAALARMEGRIAIGRLVRRFPQMELVDTPPEWNGRLILRGLETLPVTLRRS